MKPPRKEAEVHFSGPDLGEEEEEMGREEFRRSALKNGPSVSNFTALLAEDAYKTATRYHIAQAACLALTFLTLYLATYSESRINEFTGHTGHGQVEGPCLLFASWLIIPWEKCRTFKALRLKHTDNTTGWLGCLDILDEEGESRTKWGHGCSATQYGLVVSTGIAFIFSWFFLFVRPTRQAFNKRKVSGSFIILIPTTILTGILSVHTLSITLVLSTGYISWAESLSVNNIGVISSYSDAGRVVISSEESAFDRFDYKKHGLASIIFCWLGSIGWCCFTIISILRVYNCVDCPEYFFSTLQDYLPRKTHIPLEPTIISNSESDTDHYHMNSSPSSLDSADEIDYPSDTEFDANCEMQ